MTRFNITPCHLLPPLEQNLCMLLTMPFLIMPGCDARQALGWHRCCSSNIDIPMNENNMQPLVLVIATPRLAKELSKTLPDVQSFAHPISVETKRLPQFPSDKLSVWAESSSMFYELMTDKVMDLLFGRAAFDEASKYFRYLHFSSENPEGFSKHSLKLSFDLPQKEQMQDLTKVLTAVLHLIDVSHFLSFSPTIVRQYIANVLLHASRCQCRLCRLRTNDCFCIFYLSCHHMVLPPRSLLFTHQA